MAVANAKARVRGNLLRTLTNAHRGLLLGTENRTESLLGYFTAGGDDQADLEPLAPFLKAQVRQIAAHLGVPAEVIDKAPSADLWAGQTDEVELGFSYEAADLILYYAGEHADAKWTERRMLEGAAAMRPRFPSTEPPLDEIRLIPKVLARRDRTRYKRLGKPRLVPANRTHH
jgi:NAD+ synthetase